MQAASTWGLPLVQLLLPCCWLKVLWELHLRPPRAAECAAIAAAAAAAAAGFCWGCRCFCVCSKTQGRTQDMFGWLGRDTEICYECIMSTSGPKADEQGL
jgi:hypothetical protein